MICMAAHRKCRGWRESNIRKGLIKHLCKFNCGSQRCTIKGVCPNSWKKAADQCELFQKREATA